MSYQGDYKPGPHEESDEEGSYSEDEESDDEGGFTKDGAPKPGYQPQNYPQGMTPSYTEAHAPPSYPQVQAQGYPPQGYPPQGQQPTGSGGAGAYPGVGYRGPSPVTARMDLNRSKDSADTFV